MADLFGMLQAASGSGGGEPDPNFNQTVLLLHGDGTNGAQNNTFLDSSTNNFTITRNGNTTQGTFSPFSVADGEWSNYFDGTGDYLSFADNAAFDLGSGAFTLEAWINMTDVTPSKAEWIICQWQSDTHNSWGFRVETNGALNFYYSTDGNNSAIVGSASPGLVANTWHHIAVVRSSNTVTIYVDGVSKASGTVTATFLNSTASVMVGNQAATGLGQTFTGYISNARVVKGTAVYTSAFTPPTSPLTAVSGTSLLTCQSNRFVDNSSNAFAITVNGNTSVQPFSPFAPSAAYSASVNGGSGYFDGSGDYLSGTGGAATQMGTGAFTWECWCYITTAAAFQCFIDTRPIPTNGSSTGMGFILFTGTLTPIATTTDTILTSSIDITKNAWTHVALTRTSGGTLTIWVNGQSGGTTSNSSDLTDTALFVGGNSSSPHSALVNGYLSNTRITKGADLYTTAFTPPTAPFTTTVPSGTTGLLLNYTNAGIFDNTGKNNLETVGNAQIDTTTKKYGTGSMEFDGTGDYLNLPSSQNLSLGGGDYTVECFVYLNSSKNQGIWDGRNTNSSTAGVALYVTSGNAWRMVVNNATFTVGGSITNSVWTHVAVVRSGSTITVYVDGSSVNTTTSANNLTDTSFLIGTLRDNPDATANFKLDGFIDDLRITKGVARYTANFTPPTAAFPDL